MPGVARVTATPAAQALVVKLAETHGPLMFHQSGGCCDGSSPMCYPRGELHLGPQDVLLGEVAGQPFYIGAAQYRAWQHTQLILDVVAGRGGMFSLEGPGGQRFHTRSRPFTEQENAELLVQPLDVAQPPP